MIVVGKSNQETLERQGYQVQGEVISVDQLESSIPGFIGQMTGKLTKQCIVASTIRRNTQKQISL
jgi:hypothetical protein